MYTNMYPRSHSSNITTPLLPSMSTSIISGAAFGSALVAAGVYQPPVILGQFSFDNFQMLQTFLAASATST